MLRVLTIAAISVAFTMSLTGCSTAGSVDTAAPATAKDLTPAPAQVTGDTMKYVASTAQGEMLVTIVDRLCVDTMSGMPHPQTVTVLTGGQTLHGCGGEPALRLRGAEWTVTGIGGVPVTADPRVTLEFGLDGRVAGPAPLMAQEQKFFEALAGVRGLSVPAAGRLQLQSGDGRDVEARRP